MLMHQTLSPLENYCWAYDLTVGLGTQKVVAAIRDQAGNTTRVTNEVFLTVVTNGAYQYNTAGCVTNITYKHRLDELWR